MKKEIWILGLILLIVAFLTEGVKLNKNLLYDQHTLNDTYKYGEKVRGFSGIK